MKKIPTLFEREYGDDGRVVAVKPDVRHGCEWALAGDGVATEKVDGACCAIINGRLWKRFDAKPGRKIPQGAIPCQPTADPITGHWPHWVMVDAKSKGDKWFVEAWVNTPWATEDGTYEAVGLHFQGNPYGLDADFLERHGRIKIKDCPRTFDGIREWLRVHEVEGIVWWKDGEPKCKIKRKDFGFKWPVREEQ